VNEDRLESGRYLRALQEHWPYIFGTVVFALAAALAFVTAAERRYDAGTDVLVTPVPSDTLVGIPLFRESDLSRSVVTAARIATSPQVVEGVRERLQLDLGRRELLSYVSVTPQEQSSILTITGRAATPEEAARIANTFAEVLIAQRTAKLQREVRRAVARLSRQLERLPARGATAEATALASQLSALRTLMGAPDPTLEVVSRAVPPERAAWPRPVVSVVVALLAGLLLGMGIAVALELFNPLVLTESDIVEPGGPPILARVPWTPQSVIQKELARHPGTLPNSARPFRAVWVNLAAHTGRSPETILVTGAGSDEGRASAAISLSIAVAVTGVRVVLVDADVAKGASSRLLADVSASREGLRALLLHNAPVEEVLIPTKQLGERLRVLTTHKDDEALLSLVPPERLESLVDELKRVADVVILDAPPTPDSLLLAGAVDAVVVTVRLGRTRLERVLELRRDLAQRGSVPAGYVMVSRRRSSREWLRQGSAPGERAVAAVSVEGVEQEAARR
jgi:succinoglycan biosynthesis transport protein ExoP